MKFNHTKIENVWQIVDYIDNKNIFFINTNKKLCCFSNGIIIDIDNTFKNGIIQKWNSTLIIDETYYLKNNKITNLFTQDIIYSSLIINKEQLLVKKIDFETEKVIFGIFNLINSKISWFDQINY